MSYEILLYRPTNSIVVEEDHVIEDDRRTVILNRPMNNVGGTIVRINDFRRDRNHKTELLVVDDVSSQFTGTEDTIFVIQGPIYNGLKLGQYATEVTDVKVKINVIEEDVSGQFTGAENYFITQGKPLFKSNKYDFSSSLTKSDIVVKINGTALETSDIDDISPYLGRIQLVNAPLSTDTVTVTYSFRATVNELDAENSKIVINEIPTANQEVTVKYYASLNDGWTIEKSQRSLLENSRDVIFSRPKNTSRVFTEKENISNQFNGTNNECYVSNTPILPLYQTFDSTLDDVLNNSVSVFVNDEKVLVSAVIAETGYIRLVTNPKTDDLVQVSYYYQMENSYDRISVDYSVERDLSNKYSGQTNLSDYQINNLGNYKTIINEEKLMQDLRKIVVTGITTDKIATWYGTSFSSIIGVQEFPEIVKTKIAAQILEALTRLKNIQIQQEEYQEVTDNEFLDFVRSLTVVQSELEPTYYTATADVTTQAGTKFTLNEPIIFSEDLLFQ